MNKTLKKINELDRKYIYSFQHNFLVFLKDDKNECYLKLENTEKNMKCYLKNNKVFKIFKNDIEIYHYDENVEFPLNKIFEIFDVYKILFLNEKDKNLFFEM